MSTPSEALAEAARRGVQEVLVPAVCEDAGLLLSGEYYEALADVEEAFTEHENLTVFLVPLSPV